jgi:hypothetical protein
MMTRPLSESATVRDLLFEDVPDTSKDALTKALHKSGTVSALIPSFLAVSDVAERKVAEATDDQLSLNLVDLVVGGWKTYGALREAAERTHDAPGAEEFVAMVTHKIDSSHHPSVELYVDGESICTIEMTLRITFTMAGVLAVVKEAQLTAIKSGNCTVAASLTIAGVEVAKKQRKLDLPGVIRLRRGIALLEPTSDSTHFNKAAVGGPDVSTTASVA